MCSTEGWGRTDHLWLNGAIAFPLGVVLLIFIGTISAHAQIAGGHGGRQKTQQQTSKTSAAPTTPESVSDMASQLLPGAILCSSDSDLVKYQKAVTVGFGSPLDQILGCHAVQQATNVEILDHDGSSRTQVVTTDDAQQKGWTNSYLPSSATGSDVKKLH